MAEHSPYGSDGRKRQRYIEIVIANAVVIFVQRDLWLTKALQYFCELVWQGHNRSARALLRTLNEESCPTMPPIIQPNSRSSRSS